MSCTCTKIPLENKVKGSKVTAYTTAGDCPFCVAQREAAVIDVEAQKAAHDKAVMINLKMKEMAEKELKKEGKL